ncbi:hypothetical protein SAMN04487904_106137 [Actinopolyspora lacussalsi subsp. righensis]|uniref:Uncharacterized protein n=2 Tax=Actinopolyspora righensis TaxID=995060 RepID=A0A1I7A8S4_9ACTN|nr:hypothetical protein SAMN04487904_106137 [Actinopolyspora righensis]
MLRAIHHGRVMAEGTHTARAEGSPEGPRNGLISTLRSRLAGRR